MILKLLSKEQLLNIGYHKDAAIWINKEEYHRRRQGGEAVGYFSVVEIDELTNTITNDIIFKNDISFAYTQIEDSGLIKIYGWASEAPITKETNPEYYL